MIIPCFIQILDTLAWVRLADIFHKEINLIDFIIVFSSFEICNDYTPKVCISWFLITKPLHVGKCLITEKEWCFLLSISFSQWLLRDLPFRNRQRNVSRFIFNLTVQMWLFWLIKRGNMLCRSKCWNLICCEQTKTNEVSTFWST